MLFVKKKDGSWRLYIDYQEISKASTKSKCSLPRIDDLFEQLVGSTMFSKIDLKSWYQLLKVKKRMMFLKHPFQLSMGTTSFYCDHLG